jgi:hypothetical protein
MSYLIAGIFLINTGITVGLVALFRYEADRKLADLRDEHYTLILELARQRGRDKAELNFLRSNNASR